MQLVRRDDQHGLLALGKGHFCRREHRDGNVIQFLQCPCLDVPEEQAAVRIAVVVVVGGEESAVAPVLRERAVTLHARIAVQDLPGDDRTVGEAPKRQLRLLSVVAPVEVCGHTSEQLVRAGDQACAARLERPQLRTVRFAQQADLGVRAIEESVRGGAVGERTHVNIGRKRFFPQQRAAVGIIAAEAVGNVERQQEAAVVREQEIVDPGFLFDGLIHIDARRIVGIQQSVELPFRLRDVGAFIFRCGQSAPGVLHRTVKIPLQVFAAGELGQRERFVAQRVFQLPPDLRVAVEQHADKHERRREHNARASRREPPAVALVAPVKRVEGAVKQRGHNPQPLRAEKSLALCRAFGRDIGRERLEARRDLAVFIPLRQQLRREGFFRLSFEEQREHAVAVMLLEEELDLTLHPERFRRLRRADDDQKLRVVQRGLDAAGEIA